jgi:lipoprotein LprG
MCSLLLLLAACGSSSPGASPQTLLQQSKQVLDSTPGVHFTLDSSNVGTKGTVIKGGQGDLVHPDRLQGSLDLLVKGFPATVKVVAVGSTVEAQLPFSTTYSKIDPSTFGLGNPADLLSSQRGLSSLLTAGTNPQMAGTERIGGELLQKVKTTVPGTAVPLLPDQNPNQPVALVAAINPSNHQLRQVTLTGPFTSATTNSTYIVTLTNYGQQPQINLPPVS